MGYFASAGQILIDFFFGTLVLLVLMRILLQLVRANFYNPICQFLYRTTNPVLMPLRRVIPAWRTLDIAGVVLAWLLCAIWLWLRYAMAGVSLGVAGLFVMALAHLIGFLLMPVLVVLLLARIVLSYLNPEGYHPIVPLVFQLTEPILKPIRRILPSIAGFDLSPMVAWLAIAIARVLIVQPLFDFGVALAKGL